jgi:hypothetical protein
MPLTPFPIINKCAVALVFFFLLTVFHDPMIGAQVEYFYLKTFQRISNIFCIAMKQ